MQWRPRHSGELPSYFSSFFPFRRRRGGVVLWWLVAQLLLAWQAAPAAGQVAPSESVVRRVVGEDIRVEWNGEVASVWAERCPLARVLAAVGEASGVELAGGEGLEDPIALQLARVSLGELLERLLAGLNYAVLYGEDAERAARPRRVQILGRRGPIVGAAGSLTYARAGSSGPANPEPGPSDFFSPLYQDSPWENWLTSELQQERLQGLYASLRAGTGEGVRRALTDPDETVRETALQLLAGLNPEEALETVLELVESPDASIRLEALEWLSRLAPEETLVVDKLGEALAEGQPEVRAFALQALAERRGREVDQHLRRALRDPDPNVRLLLIDAVGERGEEGISLLREALLDAHPTVRSQAEVWLDRILTEER